MFNYTQEALSYFIACVKITTFQLTSEHFLSEEGSTHFSASHEEILTADNLTLEK